MKINEKIKKEFPWGAGREWKARTRAIAKAIPPRCSVLDLGGGFCHLLKYLEECPRYLSLDLKKWTDRTVEADFNAGSYPDLRLRYDVLVAQGIIEYLDDPAEFLERIQRYGSRLLITYRPKECKRPEDSFRLSLAWLDKALRDAGWKVVFGKHLTPGEVLYYCSTT